MAGLTLPAQTNSNYDPNLLSGLTRSIDVQPGLTIRQSNPTSMSTSTPQVAGVSDTRDSGYYNGGSSTATNYDPTAVFNANDIIAQANLALSRIGSQGQVGNSNIDSTFGNYRTGLQNSFNRDQADYNQNKITSTQQNEQAKNTIDRRTAARANGLSRYLGANGAGDSQAAYVLAPYAAARTGTQQRNQVNQAYGANMQALDQSWNRYNTDYNNSLLSLGDQEKQARDQLQSQLLEKELNARNQLTQGQAALKYAQTGDPAQAEAIRNSTMPGLMQLLQQIDALGRTQVTPQVADPTYSAPALQQYTIQNAQNTQYADPVQAQSVDPAYQYLLKKLQDNQLSY